MPSPSLSSRLALTAALLVGWCASAPPSAAQFVNGNFETGDFTGWTIEYGSFDCGTPDGWTTVQSVGHPGAALHTSASPPQVGVTLDVEPYGGAYTARLNNVVGGGHATRIHQTIPLPFSTADQYVTVDWGAVLSDPTGHANCSPEFTVEVRVGGGIVDTFTADGIAAGTPDSGWSPAGSYGAGLWYRRGSFCSDVTGYAPGTPLEVRATVSDCGYGGHGGFAFLDNVRLKSTCGSCYVAPEGLTGWWPLDEPADTGQLAADVARGNAGARFGALASTPDLVDGALTFDGLGTWIEVPDPPDGALDVGDTLPPIQPDDGAFSVDAWIKTTQTAGRRTIVYKRACLLIAADSCQPRGYTFFCEGERLGVELIEDEVTSTTFVSDPLPWLFDGEWHLVAVTVDRQVFDGVRFYADGAAVGPFDLNALDVTGTLENDAPFYIGTAAGIDTFDGELDEVEFFQRALAPEEIAELYLQGDLGKCKASVSVPACLAYCSNDTELDVPVTIFNGMNGAQDFAVTISPIEAGGDCDVDGPFGLSFPEVHVEPGETKVAYVSVPRPPGLTAPGQKACYRIRIWTAAGLSFETTGQLGLLPPQACLNLTFDTLANVELGVAPGLSLDLEFEGIAATGGGGPFFYRLEAVGQSGGAIGATALGLDGQAPGVDVTGAVDFAAGETVTVSVKAHEHHPLALQEVRLWGDADLDGLEELLATAPIATRPGLDPDSAQVTVRLGVPPNAHSLLPGTTTGPVLGATWDPAIEHDSGFAPWALLDLLVIATSPSVPATGLPLGSPGVLLCDPGAILGTWATAPGTAFALPLPDPNPAFVGLVFHAQGASLGATEYELTNALDLALGLY